MQWQAAKHLRKNDCYFNSLIQSTHRGCWCNYFQCNAALCFKQQPHFPLSPLNLLLYYSSLGWLKMEPVNRILWFTGSLSFTLWVLIWVVVSCCTTYPLYNNSFWTMCYMLVFRLSKNFNAIPGDNACQLIFLHSNKMSSARKTMWR